MNVILGGGLAGVSTAYHLRNSPTLLIERENELGGTARSFKVKNFTFDFTGHLLHLHHSTTKKLISKLLQGNFYRCTRNAWIYSQNTASRFPYQANTHGLPGSIVDRCVLGFLEAHLDNQTKEKKFSEMNFQDWCLSIFGQGISEEFMIPYNQKLYQTAPKKMTVDWCGPFVPQVKLEEVIRGALVDQKKGFGYNTEFLYPKEGGIQVLAQALGRNLKNVSLETSLKQVDWKNKTVTLSDGRTIRYANLINTIPLKVFLSMVQSPPASLQRAQRQLKAVGLLCLNIGINRTNISKASWIYFPEKKYPFYRVGFPMNFTPHVVPKGCSSMYVEIPMNVAKKLTHKEILKRVKTGLIDAGILKAKDEWVVTQFLPIPFAYVVYDKVRASALRTIFNFLEKNSIQSIGRYGAWKYSFMEEAILDGKKAADKILAQQN